MQVGFKTGPRTWDEARTIVAEDGLRLCEVWFDVTAADEYTQMLAWLTGAGVRVGLHHWGLVSGKLKTNLATDRPHVRDESIRQIKQTIDIGAAIGCAYVNAHPGSQSLEEVNFANRSQRLLPDKKTPAHESRRLLLEAGSLLSAYAKTKGVVFTIETLPPVETLARDTGVRDQTYVPGNTPLPVMVQLARSGTFIANDVTHTAACVAVEQTSEPDGMWQGVLEFTRAVAGQTRLLHVNTVVPPFNGTDSHNGFLPEDVAAGAWPRYSQLQELLRLFKQRDDIFVIPEPRQRMRENTQALLALVESL